MKFGTLALLTIALLSGQKNSSTLFRAEFYENTALTEDAPLSASTRPAMSWTTPHLGVGALPPRLSPAGFTMQRRSPYLMRIEGVSNFAAGDYEIGLRSTMKARLYLDGQLILSSEVPKEIPLTPTQIAEKEAADKQAREEAAKSQADREAREEAAIETLAQISSSKDEKARKAVQEELDRVRNAETLSSTKPPSEMLTATKSLRLSAGQHRLRLEFTGKSLSREVSVILTPQGASPRLLSAKDATPIAWNVKAWEDWRKADRQRIADVTAAARAPLADAWESSWKKKHDDLRRAHVPAKANVDGGIDRFLDAKMAQETVKPAPLASDHEFARRVYLDAWGLIPTAEELKTFLADKSSSKRATLVAKLLKDDRWADPWVSYWEDVLAENPVMFGQVPNSTGPFKRWIHNTFLNDRGYDRLATELVLMEGVDDQAGTIGFRESMGNDLPPAEKAFVVAQAFMAANMKCARCHDSPVNQYKQRDLFGIAALLEGHAVVVPATSSVGEVPGRRKPAVKVTSKPGDAIPPAFVFDPNQSAPSAGPEGRETREALATWLTQHPRFAEVGVNRIWKRFFGIGLVEPIDSWPRNPKISHPELLAFLAAEFRGSGFSVKHIEKLILTSQAYQRERNRTLAAKNASDGLPLFAAQPIRRMRAEEIVDSLHRSVGREFKSEKMAYGGIDYGYPKRTWQLVTLSNEEDNMILVRPRMQEIITAANVFGWRDQRPDPVSVRNDDPTPLQPLTLANGGLMNRLVRLTDSNAFTRLAYDANSLPAFATQLFHRTLGRDPSPKELGWLDRKLAASWSNRRIDTAALQQDAADKPSEFQDMMDAYRQIAEARKPEPATVTLSAEFQKSLESVLWVLFNSPEFLFVP